MYRTCYRSERARYQGMRIARNALGAADAD